MDPAHLELDRLAYTREDGLMGARSRRKGAAFEREVARLFREAGINPCERNVEECRTGNSNGIGDLILPSWCPLTAQIKVGAAPSPWRALKEAREAAGDARVPVAIIRRNGAGSRPPEDLAVLPLEDFLDLINGLRGSGWW